MKEPHTDLQVGAKKVLVVLPNWVGDVVLATPTLKALRKCFDSAHIAYLMRPYVGELLEPCPWCDSVFHWPQSRSKAGRQHEFLVLAGRLRKERFDLAVLLANSFRSALLARLSGISRRVGYDRDGRGLLLTDRLLPHRKDGKYVPVSMVRYYAGLARYLNCEVDENDLSLPLRPEDEQAAASLISWCGIGPDEKVVLMNPGAKYGSAKCWLPERFAEVARHLSRSGAVRVMVVCAPEEAEVARRIEQLAGDAVVALADKPVGLGLLKGLIKRCDLLITNDTGPRHIAKAFRKPVVTIFGPTDPRWTETDYDLERKVSVPVECGPCMLKRCPLDHRCMQLVTADMVANAAAELLAVGTGEKSDATVA